MPLHEVNNHARRLFAQFEWKLCFMKAGPGLTCETPFSQWTTPLPNGPFVSPVLVKALLYESRFWLDLRDATHRSGQPLPGGPFVCPELEKIGCVRTRLGRGAVPRIVHGRCAFLATEPKEPASCLPSQKTDLLPCGPFVCPMCWKVSCLTA